MRVGVVIAVVAIILVIASVAPPLLDIDSDTILRFIAPTAYETRSIEETLEGGGP